MRFNSLYALYNLPNWRFRRTGLNVGIFIPARCLFISSRKSSDTSISQLLAIAFILAFSSSVQRNFMMYLRPPSVDAAFFLGGVATGVGRGMGALPPSPQAGFRALCGPKAELALINPGPFAFNSALPTSHFLEWEDSTSETVIALLPWNCRWERNCYIIPRPT